MKYDCLMIDDEKLLADSTAEYFNLFGVRTAVAYSVSECRRFFRENTAAFAAGYQSGGRQRLCPV